MKARVKEGPEARGAGSIPDMGVLPPPATARFAARQVCIGDMEEELHKAFAIAR